MTTSPDSERLAGPWTFNPVHSAADFSIDYVVATFRASFPDLTASFEDGVLSGSVKVATIAVKDARLAGHLQSPDFFDGENHPEIVFTSKVLGVDGDALKLDGELTMKGVTKPVLATGTVNGPTEDFMSRTRLGFVLESKINRTDFGVSWNAPLPRGDHALSEEVRLSVVLDFNRKAAG